MIRKLLVSCAVVGLAVGVSQADSHMMAGPGPGPEVILGPPEGFMPPPDMPKPMPTGDPEADKQMMVEHFFNFIDADGSGAIDMFEFRAWVRGVHMPSPDDMMPPPDGMMPPPDGMMPPPDGMMPPGGGDDMMGDGILRAGEGDLAGLHMAPDCSDELRDSELTPQAEGVPCGDRAGNLIFRTICNMPGYDAVAISLPDGRAAGCFGLEALRGAIGFQIVTEDGMPVWDTTMGKESYRDLKLDGPGIYHIRSTGGSPDGAVTIRFVDVPTGM